VAQVWFAWHTTGVAPAPSVQSEEVAGLLRFEYEEVLVRQEGVLRRETKSVRLQLP